MLQMAGACANRELCPGTFLWLPISVTISFPGSDASEVTSGDVGSDVDWDEPVGGDSSAPEDDADLDYQPSGIIVPRRSSWLVVYGAASRRHIFGRWLSAYPQGSLFEGRACA